MVEEEKIVCPLSCHEGKRAKCPDCECCQNCSQSRCRLCRKGGCGAKASSLGSGFTYGQYLEWKRRQPG